LDELPNVAEIAATVLELTAVVVTVNLAEVFPAGTTTVAATTAELLLETNLIAMPPAGAVVPRVTVPVEVLPPTTEGGLKVKPVIDGGLIVRFAVSNSPFTLAEIFATV
jgi:hypothetical protein